MSDTPGLAQSTLPPPPLPPSDHAPRRRSEVPSLAPIALVWLLVASIAGDIALRSGVASVSSAICVLIIAIPILGRSERVGFQSRCFLGLAVLFALWLPVRASTWLTFLNTSAVVACLVAAVITVRPATWRWNTSTVATALVRMFLGSFFAIVLRRSVAPLRSEQMNRLAPVARGIAIAAVPLAVLTAMLASADVVFAASISTDVDPSNWIEHLLAIFLVGAGIAGLVAMAGAPAREDFSDHRPLGAIEALVVLGGIGALYAVFAVVQLVSSLGGADRILEQQGLTYAEYARSGFFQLLWVAGLTAMMLATVRLLVASRNPVLDRAIRCAGALVALLTIVIVAVAIVRLGLYTDEFGQTTLRWYCTAFAWMLGLGFVAIAIGHHRRAQSVLPMLLLGLVVGTLLAVNVLNPEARVAEHNLERADAAQRLDADYLARLSADAWPALVDNEQLMMSRLFNSGDFDRMCEAAAEHHGYGPLGFNVAMARLDC